MFALGAGLALAAPSVGSAASPQTGCTPGSGSSACGSSRIFAVATHLGNGACSNQGGSSPEAIDPQSGSVSDPGAPWGISASAVPNMSHVLLFRCDGTVDVANAGGAGSLTPVGFGVHGVGLVPQASLDPTGRFVTFVGSNGDIDYAQVGNGAAPTDLGVVGSQPRISPDGARIAFLNAGDDVAVMRTDGSGLRVVVAAAAMAAQPVYGWFPDSLRLVLLGTSSQRSCNGFSPEHFVTVDVTTGALSQFPLNESACPAGPAGAYFVPTDIAASPDGTQVAIAGAYSQCSAAPGYDPKCSGGELGSPGLFFQAQIATVPASGGNLAVIRKLPGACIDPANASCVDPSGGAVAPANTDPTYAQDTLFWSGAPKLPVVLVTGLADSHPGMTPGGNCKSVGSMSELCTALQAAGFPVYVVSSAAGPGSVLNNRLGFDVNARGLADYLTTVVGRPALLVGHSMGGIFSRIAISRYRANEDGLFTIGSPMDGSFGADLAVGAALFPCVAQVACGPLLAGGAYALSHFGPAAMLDLTAIARAADNARLGPVGVTTWTLAGTACHPFGTGLSGLDYLFPDDGIVGLSSAFGVGANLGPTTRSTVNAYHETQLQSTLGPLCGIGGIELTESTVIAQVLNAANQLQLAGPAPDLPTAHAATAARRLRLVIHLQAGSVRTVKPNSRIHVDAGTTLLSRQAFSLRCGRRVIAALPAIGGRAFGFPDGTLPCRTASLKVAHPLSLGIASDPQNTIVTVIRTAGGYQLTVSAAQPIDSLRLSRGSALVRARQRRRGHRTITVTLSSKQTAGLTVTATVRSRRYTATLPPLG